MRVLHVLPRSTVLTSSSEPFSTLNLPALCMAPSASLEISCEETQNSLSASHHVHDTLHAVEVYAGLNEVTIPISHTFRAILIINMRQFQPTTPTI